MTKSELIERLAESQSQLTAKDMELAVKLILDQMADSLARGERIEIRGFGVLGVKDTKPKPAARNPRTGEIVYVPARKKSYFKAGVLIKKALHQPLEPQEAAAEETTTPTESQETPSSSGFSPPSPLSDGNKTSE